MTSFALFVSYCAGGRGERLKAHFAGNVGPNVHCDAVAQQCDWKALAEGVSAQCGHLLRLVTLTAVAAIAARLTLNSSAQRTATTRDARVGVGELGR
jgi:hypothetical protein